MRKVFIRAAVAVVLVVQAGLLLAGELKTVTLSVEKMTCNMCPVTVKKALRNIDGVTVVEAKYEGKGEGWAKVTFDADKTSIDDLTFATTEAGYPSEPKM